MIVFFLPDAILSGGLLDRLAKALEVAAHPPSIGEGGPIDSLASGVGEGDLERGKEVSHFDTGERNTIYVACLKLADCYTMKLVPSRDRLIVDLTNRMHAEALAIGEKYGCDGGEVAEVINNFTALVKHGRAGDSSKFAEALDAALFVEMEKEPFLGSTIKASEFAL